MQLPVPGRETSKIEKPLSPPGVAAIPVSLERIGASGRILSVCIVSLLLYRPGSESKEFLRTI